MTKPRTVRAETLDGLAAHDPAAMRSRRDLRRVHRAMGTRSTLLRALRSMTLPRQRTAPLRVLEIGAGDASLMLGVARRLAPEWPTVALTLLDRQALVDRATIEAYAALGWAAATEVVDVLDWVAAGPEPLSSGAVRHWDIVIANLFLHHFEDEQLSALLGAIALCCDRFLACEPRRDWLALASSRLIGVLGVNAVTRHDAVLSVHAGFRGRELTKLWPAQGEGWRLQEFSAGPFSHCFRAERASPCTDSERH